MRAPLLGIIGKKRAGKDSLASFLVMHYGFSRVAFADPLKDAALALDPIIEAEPGFPHIRLSELVEFHGWEDAKEIPEVRRTLQNFGVGIRDIDSDFWVRAGLEVAESLRSDGIPVVLTDVRFPNEADAIVWAGGELVRVVRPGLLSADTHVSETALDRYETQYHVRNDGGLGDLSAAADALAHSL